VFYICICKSLANGFKTWNQLAARYIANQADLIPRPGPSSKVRQVLIKTLSYSSEGSPALAVFRHL
jgi:hypothetical protein